MSVCCIGGVCIPLNAIWPLLLFLIQPIWSYIQKVMGWEKVEAGGKVQEADCDCCKENKMAEKGKGEEKNSTFSFPTSPFDYEGTMDWDDMILSEKPVFVKMTASWCKPCKVIAPTFDDLAIKHTGAAHFLSLDVDENEDIVNKYGVVGIPHFLCFQKGGMVDQIKSSESKKVTSFVEKLCVQ